MVVHQSDDKTERDDSMLALAFANLALLTVLLIGFARLASLSVRHRRPVTRLGSAYATGPARQPVEGTAAGSDQHRPSGTQADDSIAV